MRVLAVIAVLAGVSAGEDLARATKARRRAQAEFWRAYPRRLAEAQDACLRPVRDAYSRASKDKEAVYDLAPYRQLYEDYAAIEDAYGRAAEALAKSDDPEAPRALLRELFETIGEADRAEEALREASAIALVYEFDQRPGITRNGLARRERALVQALALHPAFLSAEAWPEAVKGDGRRSHARRVAVLDALGASGRPEARPALAVATGSPEPPIRIAAIEGLALHGRDATPALLPLLRDRSDVVRRALADSVRSRLAADPRWIRPVLDEYDGTAGSLRRGMLEALRLLTGQALGDAPGPWEAWYAAHREEIEGGTFVAKAPVGAPTASGPTFYGVPLSGRGTILLLDWCSVMLHPADWEFERTRYQPDWLYGDQSWKGEHETHLDFLLPELDRALRGLGPEQRFAIVLGTDGFRGRVEQMKEYVLGWDRLLPLGASDRASRFVRARKPYHWRSQLSMLLTAFAIADRDPVADSAILLSDGGIQGGHYLDPAAALEAFARWNRFRRIVVDTVRIRDAKEDAKRLMEGIARLSGGRAVWLRNPPAGK